MGEEGGSRFGKIALQLAVLPWVGWVLCKLPFG